MRLVPTGTLTFPDRQQMRPYEAASETDSTAVSLPRGVGFGWCVSEARGSFCDQLGGWFCVLGLTLLRLEVRHSRMTSHREFPNIM